VNRVDIESGEDPRIEPYRDLKDRELRRRMGLFVVEGRGNLRCLLERSAHRPRSVLVNPAALESLYELLGALPADVPIYVARPPVLESIVGFDLHRGCLAVCDLPEETSLEALLESPALQSPDAMVVLVEGLTDLDNLGGVFRNALSFGAAAVLLSPGCCDPLYRKAIRTSMGATLCVPFARAEAWPEAAFAILTGAGFEVVALDPGGDALLPGSAATGGRVALLLGTEGAGISAEALAAATRRVRIDMAPGVDSLNVATASGIAMHHFFHGEDEIGER